jgi:hypothetical protein
VDFNGGTAYYPTIIKSLLVTGPKDEESEKTIIDSADIFPETDDHSRFVTSFSLEDISLDGKILLLKVTGMIGP